MVQPPDLLRRFEMIANPLHAHATGSEEGVPAAAIAIVPSSSRPPVSAARRAAMQRTLHLRSKLNTPMLNSQSVMVRVRSESLEGFGDQRAPQLPLSPPFRAAASDSSCNTSFELEEIVVDSYRTPPSRPMKGGCGGFDSPPEMALGSPMSTSVHSTGDEEEDDEDGFTVMIDTDTLYEDTVGYATPKIRTPIAPAQPQTPITPSYEAKFPSSVFLSPPRARRPSLQFTPPSVHKPCSFGLTPPPSSLLHLPLQATVSSSILRPSSSKKRGRVLFSSSTHHHQRRVASKVGPPVIMTNDFAMT